MANAAMDVAASTLNMTKSVIESPLAGTLLKAGEACYNWLLREQVDEEQFKNYLQFSSNLGISPNEAGFELQKSIAKADRKVWNRFKPAPLPLVISGSIGRLLSRDSDTMYIVTTVATLCHDNHPDFAVGVLHNMILDEEKDGNRCTDKIFRLPSAMRPVVSKIVESVHFNVTNAGQHLPGLPEELKRLHAHKLDEGSFASIVKGIWRSTEDVFIQSRHFLGDLTLWLYYHFEGILEVVVDSVVLHQTKRGILKRRVILFVDTECSQHTTDCLQTSGYFKVSLSVGQRVHTVLQGLETPSNGSTSSERQSFYYFDAINSTEHSTKRQTDHPIIVNDIQQIKLAAKKVMVWMLRVPIISSSIDGEFSFQVSPENPDSERICLVGDLFPNVPQLLHYERGKSSMAGPIFVSPDEEQVESVGSPDAEYEYRIPWNGLSSIVGCFPVLQAVIETLQRRCICQACERPSDLGLSKHGCLRRMAMDLFFSFIAHAIVEAMGGTDVSGLNDAKSRMEAVTEIFRALVQDRIVAWKAFFALASSVIIGCKYKDIQQHVLEVTNQAGDASEWVAAQLGSLVVVAAWLDFRETHSDTKAFSLECHEGCIKGVSADTGFVICEAPVANNRAPSDEDTTADASSRHVEPQPVTERIRFETAQQTDTTHVELMTLIFGSGKHTYRLLTTVRSGKYHRIVDPASLIRGIRMLSVLKCSHMKRQNDMVHLTGVNVYEFHDVVGTWSHEIPGEEIQMTKELKDPVKLNTILSLSPGGCLIRDVDRCCLRCAVREARNSASMKSRRLVNFKDKPRATINTLE